VYRCRQPSLDRVVAIKVLSSSQDDVDLEHFDREQRAMSWLSDHPNVVPVYRTGVTADDAPYLVMPRMHGEDLGQLLADVVDDRVGVGVGVDLQRLEHRDPRAGDPKVVAAQELVHREQA